MLILIYIYIYFSNAAVLIHCMLCSLMFNDVVPILPILMILVQELCTYNLFISLSMISLCECEL